MAPIHNIEENSAADWASLPAHVLDKVLYNLISFADFVRFTAVCKPWLFVAIENKKKMISSSSSHKQIPMLIVPSSDKNTQKRSLYDITKDRHYNFDLNLSYAKRFCGSSHGWLATVEENSVITLVNPFISGANFIRLPRLHLFDDFEVDEYDVHKLILSGNPLECDNYMIAVIPTGHCNLVVIKNGDNNWTHFRNLRALCDVTYFKGNFYAISQLGDTIVSLGLDEDGGFMSKPELISVKPIRGGVQIDITSYIVESSSSTGDLLFVQRYIVLDEEKYIYITKDFKVFKLKYTSDSTCSEWIEIDNIGDQVLFLGDNHSFSMIASEYPGMLQPNSIYYTDNFNLYTQANKPNGPRDMGVFNLKNKTFKFHYTLDSSHNKLPPPIWIVPTLQGKLGFSTKLSFAALQIK